MSNSRSFILKCSMCFKVFDYQVKMTEGKSSLWNFVTINPKGNKKYAVFCAPNATKVKGLIKVAQKKLPHEHRLVVVVAQHNDEELQLAEDNDFCLVSIDSLNEFGQQMLEIKNRDINLNPMFEEEVSASNFVDKVISKDRLF